MKNKTDFSDLQEKYGYQKDIYNDSIVLIDKLIASNKIDSKYRDEIIQTAVVMTIGYDPKHPDFYTHMDFDFSSDSSKHTLTFLRSLPSIGVQEEDNYDEFPGHSFVGVTVSKQG